MSDNLSLPGGNSPSFWGSPEGKLTALMAAAAAGLALFFGSAIGDFLVHAADNLLNLVITITAICAMGFMVLDPKLRAAVFYIYRSGMRWVMGQFIDRDPISIRKTYKSELEERLKVMDDNLSSLHGQEIKVKRVIRTDEDGIQQSMGLLAQANKSNDQRTQVLEGRQVERLQQQRSRVTEQLNGIELLLGVLSRVRQLSSDTIVDLDRDIQSAQIDLDLAKSSRSVVRAAMDILHGSGPGKEFDDEAVASIERQYTSALGEVDNFLGITKDLISRADLSDAASADHVMKMLDDWQSKNAGVVLGGAGAQSSKADVIADAKKQIEPPPPAITGVESVKEKGAVR